VRLLVKRTNWNLRFEDRTMQGALDQAGINAKLIRRLLCMAMLVHGKEMARGEIGSREFLLRRITTLSVYMFGILALLSEMAGREKAGLLTGEDLHVLRYFTEEAREARKQNRRLFDSGKERLGSVIFSDLEGEV
jgi:acyl-CoA dehydrogenase family protein 9